MSTSATSKAIARQQRRDAKRQGKGAKHGPLLGLVREHEQRRPRAPTKARQTPVEPLNAAQARFDAMMAAGICTFALGPAGTGKTWFAAARSAERLRDGEIERIVITRPAVEAGESLGFLPSELDEKFEPYFRPVREALEEVLGAGALEYHLKNGTIEARPLALLRGSTLKNADVILDEAQNTTPGQMKMFLTRIGEGTRVVVNGDAAQKDNPGPCGLLDAVDRLKGKVGVGVMRFTREDVVRSGFAQLVVEAYENETSEAPSVERYSNDTTNDNEPDHDEGLRRTLKA